MQGASSLQAARPASHTRSSAPARGYPSCAHGQDAANATRHCNTQPVCWPQREPSRRLLRRPWAGTGPAGARPPSSGASLGAGSFHSSGVSLSPRHPSPASPGGLRTLELSVLGQIWAFRPTDWGSACLCSRLSGKLVLLLRSLGAGGPFKQMSKCPMAAHQPLPYFTGQGATVSSRELPARPWTACIPLATAGSEVPLGMEISLAGPGRPAPCSGVDLLCDF